MSLREQTDPELVFTDPSLMDGRGVQIVGAIQRMAVPGKVIEAGKHVDTRFYISKIEHGACEFVLPPIEAAQVSHVGKTSAENAR